MHPHRSSALGYASATSAAHSRVYGACAAEAAASETSGLSVGGCIRAWADFRPYPVSPCPDRRDDGETRVHCARSRRAAAAGQRALTFALCFRH